MADTNAILQSDKSAAPSVALLFLCAFAAFELAVGVHTLLYKGGGNPVLPVVGTATARTSENGGGAVPGFVPPAPVFPSPMPSVGNVPLAPHFTDPLPTSAGSALPQAVTLPPVAPVTAPVAAPSQPAKASSTVPQPVQTTAPANSGDLNASTGNAQADELLDVAKQSRELGDDDGALQVLLRADLLVPNNARIMHEKSLTMKKLGIPEEPKAPAEPPPDGGALLPAGQPSAPPTPVDTPQASPSAAPASLNQAFGSKAAALPAPAEPVAAVPAVTVRGALSLGQCRVERDPTVLRGERLALKVPLDANSGEVIDPNQVQLDVFFYDKVNGAQVELSMADKPKVGYDTEGNFKSGHEVVSVLYNLPEFSANEVSQLGRHSYYGYVVKLYYKNRLVGLTANPPDLSTMGDSPAGKRN